MIPRLRVREPDSIAHAAWHYDMPPGGMGRLLSLFRVRQCTVTGAVELRSAGRQRHRNYLRTASLAGGTHTATARPSHRLMPGTRWPGARARHVCLPYGVEAAGIAYSE